MSLYNDEYVNDVMTCFINGKEDTRDETINSNSYSNVLKSKPLLIKTYNYRRANGRHESIIGVTVFKDKDPIKLSKEDYQKTFNYMWYVFKRDYFDLLINYIARSYNYPYSYDNFDYFKNFTFYL